MDRTPIKISSGRNKTYIFKRDLKEYGFKPLSKNSSVYIGYIKSHNKFIALKKFCKCNGLKFEINNNYGKRSDSYRYEFFKHNNPILGNFYFCVYCGALKTKNKITIDHLYPVHQVNTSITLQRKLKRMGCENVNSYQNLVAACRTCNLKKSAHLNGWIIRGKLGKSNLFQIIRWLFRGLLIITIAVFSVIELTTIL